VQHGAAAISKSSHREPDPTTAVTPPHLVRHIETEGKRGRLTGTPGPIKTKRTGSPGVAVSTQFAQMRLSGARVYVRNARAKQTRKPE
jgi:hypothetical protein